MTILRAQHWKKKMMNSRVTYARLEFGEDVQPTTFVSGSPVNTTEEGEQQAPRPYRVQKTPTSEQEDMKKPQHYKCYC